MATLSGAQFSLFSPIEAVLEDVVRHSLIRPRVVEGRGQVKLAVEEDEDGAVEAVLARLRHPVVDEERVARVAQVLPQLLVQPEWD